MRACTSVVTEIAYNYDSRTTISADISFLSENDWRTELSNLLQDMEANGSSNQRNLKGNDGGASIAWDKV
jgi:hypothetical protein